MNSIFQSNTSIAKRKLSLKRAFTLFLRPLKTFFPRNVAKIQANKNIDEVTDCLGKTRDVESEFY